MTIPIFTHMLNAHRYGVWDMGGQVGMTELGVRVGVEGGGGDSRWPSWIWWFLSFPMFIVISLRISGALKHKKHKLLLVFSNAVRKNILRQTRKQIRKPVEHIENSLK